MFKFDFDKDIYEDQDLREDLYDQDELEGKDDIGKRTASDAAAEVMKSENSIHGFNPMAQLFSRHKQAKKAALAVFKRQMLKSHDSVNKVTMSTNFIKNGTFVMPKPVSSGDVYLLIGMHVYLKGRRGFLSRLAHGALGSIFTRGRMTGLKALRIYVEKFAGDAFAEQVDEDKVFNGMGEGENEGKVSFYCALKVPQGES